VEKINQNFKQIKKRKKNQQAASQNTLLLGGIWRQQVTSRRGRVRTCHRRQAREKTRGKRGENI